MNWHWIGRLCLKKELLQRNKETKGLIIIVVRESAKKLQNESCG